MTDERPARVAQVAAASTVWECQRDGCQEPLRIDTPGYAWDLDDPASYERARQVASRMTFTHGEGVRARTREFTYADLEAGMQEEWIMAVHREQQDPPPPAERHTNPLRPLDDPRRDPQTKIVPPASAPAPADPRRQGPAPARPVRPQ